MTTWKEITREEAEKLYAMLGGDPSDLRLASNFEMNEEGKLRCRIPYNAEAFKNCVYSVSHTA